jgi:hypothetical protein
MDLPAVRFRSRLASFACLALLLVPATADARLNAQGVRAVPTYESVGLYWSNPTGSATAGCSMRYRKLGATAWSEGLALWYDARNDECRGSLVHLSPGTAYEVELAAMGKTWVRGVQFSTWPNQWPVARVVEVHSSGGTLVVAEGGSPTGYVLYQGAPGAILDGQNVFPFNIEVNASYVIVRGLTLVGAQRDAIRVSPTVTNVVIEDNDISGWGRPRAPGSIFGMHMDSAIRALCTSGPTLQRVTIQRNHIHDPRYPAQPWGDVITPGGPQAVSFSNCGGNHVIRHNDIDSPGGNFFFDLIGGEDNFSNRGSPYSDADINGNRLMHARDDGIEAEGRNMNVRIWGNYLDQTGIGIATTVTASGPVYVFRNVWNRNRFHPQVPPDQDERQPFCKAGSWPPLGHGRRYVFHNTMLQAEDPGAAFTSGGGHGMGGTGNDQPVMNTLSMNNIYHLWKPGASTFFQVGADTEAVNDMTNGSTFALPIVNGIYQAPQYADGHGWRSESGGMYALRAGTPGHDAAARIANFNDGFAGAGPDVGAHEAGFPPMRFGRPAGTQPSYTVTGK